MKFKSEKGVTGIDITLSVILISIFIGLITTLAYNLESKSKKLDRQAEAVYYAVNSIEKAKGLNFSDLPTVASRNNKLSILPDGYINDTPYYRTTEVVDYAQMPENQGKNPKPDVAKKITVTISYKDKEKDKKINLTIVKVKE